jgi:AraC-like DNA-binding protein
MKVIPFRIPKETKEAFLVQVDEMPRLYDYLHQHPEMQLTAILESKGTLIAGDYIGRFEPGDVFFIGTNQPHVFRNDPGRGRKAGSARAISIFFDEHTLGDAFWNLPELKSLQPFSRNWSGAYRVTGEKRKDLFNLLGDLPAARGVARLVAFMRILSLFERKKDIQPLTLQDMHKNIRSYDGTRLNHVIEYTFREYHRPIRLEEIAAIANLTPEAFCKYFKARTRKTYFSFLNELRVQQASHMLYMGEEKVSAIAYRTGFNNLSHFNRSFRKITGQTPSAYRSRAGAI